MKANLFVRLTVLCLSLALLPQSSMAVESREKSEGAAVTKKDISGFWQAKIGEGSLMEIEITKDDRFYLRVAAWGDLTLNPGCSGLYTFNKEVFFGDKLDCSTVGNPYWNGITLTIDFSQVTPDQINEVTGDPYEDDPLTELTTRDTDEDGEVDTDSFKLFKLKESFLKVVDSWHQERFDNLPVDLTGKYEVFVLGHGGHDDDWGDMQGIDPAGEINISRENLKISWYFDSWRDPKTGEDIELDCSGGGLIMGDPEIIYYRMYCTKSSPFYAPIFIIDVESLNSLQNTNLFYARGQIPSYKATRMLMFKRVAP